MMSEWENCSVKTASAPTIISHLKQQSCSCKMSQGVIAPTRAYGLLSCGERRQRLSTSKYCTWRHVRSENFTSYMIHPSKRWQAASTDVSEELHFFISVIFLSSSASWQQSKDKRAGHMDHVHVTPPNTVGPGHLQTQWTQSICDPPPGSGPDTCRGPGSMPYQVRALWAWSLLLLSFCFVWFWLILPHIS